MPHPAFGHSKTRQLTAARLLDMACHSNLAHHSEMAYHGEMVNHGELTTMKINVSFPRRDLHAWLAKPF